MGRATFILSFGVAVALSALVYGVGSQPSSSTVDPSPAEAGQPQQTLSVDTELKESTVVVPLQPSDDDQERTVTEATSDSPLVDQNTTRNKVPSRYTDAEDARGRITQEVETSYSLLFEHLDLDLQEKDAIRALLIEIQIADVRAYYEGGKTIDEQERSERIASIIGHPKLQQFLALERNIGKYWEVASIGSLLERRGVPLTDTQRDGLLKILVDVRDWYSTTPPSDLDRNSFDYLEHVMTQSNEYERHVVEVAPTVLSPKQVISLFEQYEYMSNLRVAAIERQKKLRVDNPTLDLPLFLPGWSEIP